MVKQLNKTKDRLLHLMEKALKKDLVILTEEMLEGHVDGTPRNFYRTYYSFLENKFYFGQGDLLYLFIKDLQKEFFLRRDDFELLFLDIGLVVNGHPFRREGKAIKPESLIDDEVAISEIKAAIKAKIFGLKLSEVDLSHLKEIGLLLESQYLSTLKNSVDGSLCELDIKDRFKYFGSPIKILSLITTIQQSNNFSFFLKEKDSDSIDLAGKILAELIQEGGELTPLIAKNNQYSLFKHKKESLLDTEFSEYLSKIPEDYLKEFLSDIPMQYFSPKRILIILNLLGEDYFSDSSWETYSEYILRKRDLSSLINSFDLRWDDDFLDSFEFFKLVLSKASDTTFSVKDTELFFKYHLGTLPLFFDDVVAAESEGLLTLDIVETPVNPDDLNTLKGQVTFLCNKGDNFQLLCEHLEVINIFKDYYSNDSFLKELSELYSAYIDAKLKFDKIF